uniref:Uncharacterized protein n=1 Tax=Anguilla anguilla TaxID=7936 RepID=A0A0E9SZH9_ANGAN
MLCPFAVTRSRPNQTPMGDFGQTCWTAFSTTIIKTPNKGISFERMVFHPSSTVPETSRICAKVFWQLMVAQHLTKAAFPPQELYPGTRNLLRNSVRFHRRN